MPETRAPIFAAVAQLAPGIWNVAGNVAAFDKVLEAWEQANAAREIAEVFPISAIDAKLLAMVTSVAEADLVQWVGPIKAACSRYEINTIRRVSAFLTTLAHEAGFRVGARENMNYSASRLSAVWPGRFGRRGPNALAREVERKPERIANLVYASRMGNGSATSGDGWRFRGAGPIQLTGRSNFTAFAAAMEKPLADAEAFVLTVEGGVMSAAWFWDVNDINRLADTPGISDETRRINGGTTGIEARERLFNKLVTELLKREAALAG
jgi:putative chitinase